MSGKLPALTGMEMIQALERGGFAVVRIRGSHHFLRHPDGRSTVVPVHSGETIGSGLVGKILRACEFDREHFRDLLQSQIIGLPNRSASRPQEA
jgi:predicted RNA binding protein YcfA (HicA-like mRNA interferase family)